MPNQRYTYTGPNSAITVKTDDNATRDVMLWHKTEVELPDDDEHVVVMVEMGYLTAISNAVTPSAQTEPAAVVTDPPAVVTEPPAGTGETPAVTPKSKNK